jgi:hypothetical protein
MAEVVTLGDGVGAEFRPDQTGSIDAVVLSRPAPAALLARLAAALRPSGHLIARLADETETLRGELAVHGLVLREPVDSGGTGVMRAQKLRPGETPRRALFVQTVVYAHLAMDVRTRLPARGLRSDPELQISYSRAPISLPALSKDAPKVLVLQRSAELRVELWRPFLAQMIRDGWIVVSEFDDYPPLMAEVMGTPNSDKVMHRFWYAHGVQTSTPGLVELFKPFNPETVLFPNAAFDLPPYPKTARPRRVFYGALSRGPYAVEVARSLAPAVRRCPDTEFEVIGDREVFEALPTTQKRFHEYMSFEAYLELMSQCVVSLSPIEARPFWDTKTDGKFLDAARAGVLTIGSPTVYDRVIRHGENGFVARDVASWSPLLEQALTDEPLRNRMARNAWEYVGRERMFANQAQARREWYWDLWRRREALNEALIARVPGLREAVSTLKPAGSGQ